MFSVDAPPSSELIIRLLPRSEMISTFDGGALALGKQAKIVSDKQVRALLGELQNHRYPARDRVVF